MDYIKGSDFKLTETSVTLGKFDGIHLGHRELIKRVCQDYPYRSVLFTFDLNPLSLFSEKELRLIYTMEERRSILSVFPLNYLIDYPFSKETADMEAELFIKEILNEKLGAKRIVVGEDFRFGRGRKGDISLLLEKSHVYGYELVAVPKLMKDGKEISSTTVRSYIKRGEILKANALLGSPYCIRSEVIHGRKLGASIGMPTINQRPDGMKLLPPFGVYASLTYVEGRRFFGITNIGVKPTIGESFPGVETWLFDFNEDVYGKIAEVCLLSFIRPEQRFSSLDELKKQVDIDVRRAREVLDGYSMEVE